MRRRNLLHLLEAFFRHPWRHSMPLILLTLCGLVYSVVSAPLYTSRGVLYVRNESVLGTLTAPRSNSYIYVSRAQIAVDEIETLLATESFLRAVIQRTDLEDEFAAGTPLEDLLLLAANSIFVRIESRQQVAIEAKADTPELAYQLALSTMETFRQYRVNLAVTDSDVARGVLSEVLVERRTELANAEKALRDYLEANPEPLLGVRRPDAQVNEIDQLRDDIDRANQKLMNVEALNETVRLSRAQAEREVDQTYVLVDSPRFPSAAAVSWLQQLAVLLMFVIVGVILSILMTVGTAVLDSSFRFPITVRLAVGLPVLGMVSQGEVLTPGAAFELEKAFDRQRTPQPLRRKLAPETEPPTLIIAPEALDRMGARRYSAESRSLPAATQNQPINSNDPLILPGYWRKNGT